MVLRLVDAPTDVVRRVRIIAIAVLAATSLSGCQVFRQPDPPETSTAAAKKSRSAPETASADLNAVRLPAPRKVIDPKAMIGKSDADLREMLGEPNAVEENPPANVWTYALKNCRLSFFLYLNVSSDTYKVLTYDVTPAEAKDKCFGPVGKG